LAPRDARRYDARQPTKQSEPSMTQPDDPRGAFPVDERPSKPVGPGTASTFDAARLDFGHHAGRTIVELASEDPDYLRWLARHPSGIRYRAEIARVLASAVPNASDWQR
jgi:hypothetical protein